MESLNDLLKEQLKDLHSAEKQLTKALPTMARKSTSKMLQEAFESHLEETNGHVERIEEIARLLDISVTGKKCKAMEGLIEEGKEAIEEIEKGSLLDAAMIGGAQRVEHYEISAYGTARTIAEHLGLAEVVELLQATLDEESAADEKLTEICQGEVLSSIPTDVSDDEEDVSKSAARPKKKASRAATG